MQGTFGDPCNQGWATAADTPVPGVWHHLAYVYDGANQLNIYVDGLLTIAGTLPYPLWTGLSTPIVIGASTYWLGGSYYNPFNGYINSVRIHGGVLSPSDVWLNYLVGPVQWQPVPVTILTQPSDLVVPEPGNGVLNVVPDGAGPFSYQWYRAGLPLPGATDSNYTFTDLPWAGNDWQFFCVVCTPYPCPSCTATSRTATVTVEPQLPVFGRLITRPENQLIAISFTALVGGQYRLDYTEKLNPPTWMPAGPSLIASNTTVWVGDPLTNRQRFYRVTRLP